MVLRVSEELLVRVAPNVVYWLYSGYYVLMSERLQKYRLHSKKDEDDKNLVSKGTVIRGVLLMQAIQFIVNTILYDVIEINVDSSNGEQPLISHARQLFLAMVALDAWQYFIHYILHMNKFLYRHIHAQHHRLVVPYAFGALYCHIVEGLLFDTVGGIVSIVISGMSPNVAVFFFCINTIKTIDDHCGFLMPWNPFHVLLENNSSFHDSHHQLSGSKYNFSSAYFVIFDRIMGTFKPYSVEKKNASEGIETRPSKYCKVN